jgi:hypothetical protein
MRVGIFLVKGSRMNWFVDEQQRLTPEGKRLVRMMDNHLREKGDMPFELRHYKAMVLKLRTQSCEQWFSENHDKAVILWDYYHPDMPLGDDLPPLNPKDPFGFLR